MSAPLSQECVAVRTLGRGLALSTWPLLLAHLEMHQRCNTLGRGLRALDTNLVRLVDLGPPLQQQPHHRLVAVLGRLREARPALLPQGMRVS